MSRRILRVRVVFTSLCLVFSQLIASSELSINNENNPLVNHNLSNDLDNTESQGNDGIQIFEREGIRNGDGDRKRRESQVPNYLAGRAERVKEYMADGNRDWIPGSDGGVVDVPGRTDSRRRALVHKERCVGIPQNLTLCRGIGYDTMRLPNLLDHDTIKEATQQASSWVPLLNLRCHADTQMFLCSLFAPVCLDRAILPCRSLCEAVRRGCEMRMLKYGFPWPEMLRCEQFPLDNDLCIGVLADNKPVAEEFCSSCNQPETFENIVDQFCNADYAVIVKMDNVVVSGADLKLVSSSTSRKILSTGGSSSKPKDLRDSVFYVEGGAKCLCNQLNTSDRSRGSKPQSKNKNIATRFLVMGQRRNGRLTVTFVQAVDQKTSPLARFDSGKSFENSAIGSSGEMAKALKSLRRGKNRVCNQKGVQKIASPSNLIELPKKSSGKKSGGKKITVKNDAWRDD